MMQKRQKCRLEKFQQKILHPTKSDISLKEKQSNAVS